MSNSSTIYNDDNFRLDMQGMTTSSKEFNLQVQVNKQTKIPTLKHARGATVRKVLVPTDADWTAVESIFPGPPPHLAGAQAFRFTRAQLFGNFVGARPLHTDDNFRLDMHGMTTTGSEAFDLQIQNNKQTKSPRSNMPAAPPCAMCWSRPTPIGLPPRFETISRPVRRPQ
ncbi:hypothetical protein MMC07_007381 [Pseudocyphellaria aurata]|nr:hypothetical protein [Pseudocyphellaria aurata]